MVILFIGSTTSILGIKSLAKGDKWLGRVYIPPYNNRKVTKSLDIQEAFFS
jgi:hypothetical protein